VRKESFIAIEIRVGSRAQRSIKSSPQGGNTESGSARAIIDSVQAIVRVAKCRERRNSGIDRSSAPGFRNLADISRSSVHHLLASIRTIRALRRSGGFRRTFTGSSTSSPRVRVLAPVNVARAHKDGLNYKKFYGVLFVYSRP